MPDTCSQIKKRLNSALHDTIPGATLSICTLPDCQELKLWLLDANYPQHQLSSDALLRIMNEPLYWIFCWASGQVLARYIRDNKQLVAGKRVVDFGCGSGVAAIAAAKAGAVEVIACDIDPLAIDATKLNAELNNVELTLSNDFNKITGDCDVILVADVLYDATNLPWLALFSRRAECVLVADSRIKNFNYPPYEYLKTMSSNTLPDLDESEEFRHVKLYTKNKPIEKNKNLS